MTRRALRPGAWRAHPAAHPEPLKDQNQGDSNWPPSEAEGDLPDPPPIWDLAPDARELRRRIAALGGDAPAVVVLKRPHYPGVPDPAFDKLVAEAASDNTVTSVFVLDGYWCTCERCSAIAEAEAEVASAASQDAARRAAAAIAASTARDTPFAPPASPRASETTLEASWAPLAAREVRAVPWHVHGSWLSDGSCGVVPGCPYRSGLVRAEQLELPDSIQLGLRDAPSGPSPAGPLGVQP